MARARSNYSSASADAAHATPGTSLAELESNYRAYQTWHWFRPGERGAPPVRIVDWDEPDMPRTIIECGRMARLHVRPVDAEQQRHPRRRRDKCIQFPLSVTANSHIGFDPGHPKQRLYLLVDPKARPVVREALWDRNTMAPMPLSQLALLAGGHHARGGYPNLLVKPIGPLTGVVYYTLKNTDGRSYYLHKQGEVSGGFPILAVSNDGRLWVAGGSYTAPTPGIAD